MNKTKPLGQKSYGSIPHFPGSRLGPGEITINEGQTRILTLKTRDKHDKVIVTEKLDGSNCSVFRNNEGRLIPLTRAGWEADTSPYEQHHIFNKWVLKNQERFDFIKEGERVCGEWLCQAHGTKYDLHGRPPFIVFDIISGKWDRLSVREILDRLNTDIQFVPILHEGEQGIPIDQAMSLVNCGRYATTEDGVEGVVYRVERKGIFDFQAKCVRSDKVDGKYFETLVWNDGLPEDVRCLM